MMTRDQVISTMATIRLYVSAKTKRTIDAILQLCEDYRTYGNKFTFNVDGDLDKEVNALLIQLSDAILDCTENFVSNIASEEDRDAIFAYIYRDQGRETATERTDRYCTQLKWVLGAYLAIGFANNLSQADIKQAMLLGLDNPYETKLFLDAVKEGEYAASVIIKGGYKFGKGVQANPINGIALTAQGMINEAFQLGTLLGYRKDPRVIGYRVHRGSGYDCPYCDSLCVDIHPLDEQVLPAHPRCCCYTTPVYSDEQ